MFKFMVEENKKEGFIKIYRSIWKNPISEKPNYIAIWIYLLSHANFKDKYTILNNKKILVKRGTFIGSLRKISRHFDISISTVKYVVEYLKAEHMIEHYPNSNFSLFKVKNYDFYNPIEHEVEHEENTNETRIKTTKKDKNVKNDIINYKNLKKPFKDYMKVKCHDGTIALRYFDEWVDSSNTKIKIDLSYYKELR